MTEQERLEDIKDKLQGEYAIRPKTDQEYNAIYADLSEIVYDYEILFEQNKQNKQDWQEIEDGYLEVGKRQRERIEELEKVLRKIANTNTVKEFYKMWAQKALEGK
jgi:uncharacterized membrane protein